MTASKVYFARAGVSNNKGLFQKLPEVIEAVGLDFIKKDSLVAVKCHFGEEGCTSFIQPVFIRKIVEKVLARQALPFLTDTATLYRGSRKDGVRALNQAIAHGFSFGTIGAPIVIADGLKSENVVTLSLNDKGKHFKSVEVAAATYYADSMVVVSHVKGHLVAGFGGAIKNLSMGLASRSTKQRMHASVTPKFKDEQMCIACGTCAEVCPEDAVIIDGIARFQFEKCVGCAECITHCPAGALQILWNESPDGLQEKMAEVASAVMINKYNQSIFINFAVNVTPDCDCMPWTDLPVVPDVGVLASFDPVAIDQASVDMINQMAGVKGTELKSGFQSGGDKFRGMRPEVDWSVQLAHAERLDMGTREYQLIEIK